MADDDCSRHQNRLSRMTQQQLVHYDCHGHYADLQSLQGDDGRVVEVAVPESLGPAHWEAADVVAGEEGSIFPVAVEAMLLAGVCVNLLA